MPKSTKDKTERLRTLPTIGRIASLRPTEESIEDTEKTSTLAVARLQHQRTEGWTEREGSDPGDDDGNGNGDRKLLVELAGDATQETHRHEYGAENKYDRDHRSSDLIHRLLGGILRRELPL